MYIKLNELRRKFLNLKYEASDNLQGYALPNCNDLFSRFEQQTSILEKLAEATDPTTDRQGHDGQSQGLVPKHLEKLKIGY